MPQLPRVVRSILGTTAILSATALASAHDDQAQHDPVGVVVSPTYVEQGNLEVVTRYADGSQAVLPTYSEWKYICGSNPAAGSVEQLKSVAEFVRQDIASPDAFIFDSGLRGAGIDMVFVIGGSVPSAALPAIAAVEAYLEGLFSDPIVHTMSISYANLGGGGVIGSTSSTFTTDTYTNSRDGLINGQDGDDTIQDFLPTGSTLPVRFSTAGTTNVSSISWNTGAYRATVGSIGGNIGSITFNTQFTFDYDPTNGVSGTSFYDILAHEVGHALGFTSAVDPNNGTVRQLDIFRFQRTDGTADLNPDDTAEFQVRARTLIKDTGGTSADDMNFDIISAEYRLSDGNPWQASHFSEQATSVGLMDPAYNGGTNFPNLFKTSDLAVFDAMGYDYPPNACPAPTFTSDPSSQTACSGSTLVLSVTTDGAVPANFQWKRGATTLADDGVRIFGATSATLTITGSLITDSGTYTCDAINPVCGATSTSGTAAVNVELTPSITANPGNQTVNVGTLVQFTVGATGGTLYRWRHNGVNLVDDGRILNSGAATMFITSVQSGDAGQYDCVVTNGLVSGQCNVTSAAATLTVNNPSACPGDLNNDRTVGESDLGILLGAWQAGPGGDLNGDNQTDEADLGILLGAWGTTCP